MSSLKKLAESAGDELQIHYVPLTEISQHFLEGNSKKHSISELQESVKRYSFRDPMAFDLTLNGGKGGIITGNGRTELLCQLKEDGFAAPRGIKVDSKGEWYVPCVFGVNAKCEEDAIAFSISHNLSALWGADFEFSDQVELFDSDLLSAQLIQLAEVDIELLPIGIDADDFELLKSEDFNVGGDEELEDEDSDRAADGEPKKLTLSDRFIVPPFSVLDARQGYWQDRKRQWLALGIQSELGRGGG